MPIDELSEVAEYEGEYPGFREDPEFEYNLNRILDTDFRLFLRPRARILDVGCGNGTFLRLAQAHGYEVEGIDVSETAVRICRELGLTASARNFLGTEPNEPFDAITMWDVAEHLPDPMRFFRRAFERLNERGVLVVKSPFVPEHAFRLQKLLPPSFMVPVLQVPSHIQFFSPQSLRLAGEINGFVVLYDKQVGSLRSRNRERVSVRRSLGRATVRLIRCVGRQRNHYVWFRKPSGVTGSR